MKPYLKSIFISSIITEVDRKNIVEVVKAKSVKQIHKSTPFVPVYIRTYLHNLIKDEKLKFKNPTFLYSSMAIFFWYLSSTWYVEIGVRFHCGLHHFSQNTNILQFFESTQLHKLFLSASWFYIRYVYLVFVIIPLHFSHTGSVQWHRTCYPQS